MNILSMLDTAGFTAGAFVFVVFMLIVIVTGLVLSYSALLRPKFFVNGGQLGIGEKSIVFFVGILVVYLSSGGLYHWYIGSIGRFFLTWIGHGLIMTIFGALTMKTMKKLFS